MNKHTVVTGANRGIGLEFCRQALQNGERVTALCREPSEELKSLDLVIVQGIDQRRPPNLEHIKDIDTLILNAGIWRDETLDNLDFDTISEQFEVNTLGPLRVLEGLKDSLKSPSTLVLISSLMGSIASNSSGGRYGYRISKAALNAAGKSLSHDLRDRGVTVILMHPGYVATDMTQFKGAITTEESVSGMRGVLATLDPQSSGSFFDYRGDVVPW